VNFDLVLAAPKMPTNRSHVDGNDINILIAGSAIRLHELRIKNQKAHDFLSDLT